MNECHYSSSDQLTPLYNTTLAESTPLHAIVNYSIESLLIIDQAGLIHFVNPAAENLFGRSRDQLVGSPFGFPLVCHEETELEIVRPNGDVVLVDMRIQAMVIEDSPAFLATLHDITARKRDEQFLIQSQQFLRSTLDALSSHIAILAADGLILAVNYAWQEFARNAGYDPYLSGVGYNYLLICDGTAGEEAPIARAAAVGIRMVIAGRQRQFYLEYPCTSKERRLWFAVRVTRFGSGDLTRVVVAHEDITHRKHAEILGNERRQVLELVACSQKIDVVSTQILRMILQHYPNLIYAALALPDTHVQHTSRWDLPTDVLERLDEWTRARANERPGHGQIERCLPGDPRWVGIPDIAADLNLTECWLVPIRANTGRLRGVLSIFHREPALLNMEDIHVIELVEQLLMIAIEQQEHTRQLAYQAHHDGLTGLPNRLLFEEHLRQAIEVARRTGRLIAVLFIDLDRFKQINDTLGHTIGDALLIQLARRFESYIRVADTLARRGGDEFMLVLTDVSSAQQVIKVAHRLHELLQPPFHIAGHELFVSASIGASIYPADGEDADSLQRRADAAMYRAKSTLRNSFQFFDAATNQTALEHLRLENYLRRALERNELDIYYQPKVDRAGRIVGVEALLRWKHPDLGMIPPNHFIPLAEELGLIIPIGAWCMARAFNQVRRWQRPDRPIRVSVNVSTVQFSQPGFIEGLRTILVESDLDPSLVILELTESMLIGDHSSVTQQLKSMCALGVALAIDDFGKGYSSLDYLRRLPISILKIDRAFVADIGTDLDDSGRAIVNSIVNLAHHMGMHVVAEGVETVPQRDFLHSVGCDMIQGFFYSEPLPPLLFEHLFRDDHLPGALWKE
ncbi:MAG: EAL domain-containing protein [Chloroflexales bacterium]